MTTAHNAKNSLDDCIAAYARYGHLGLAAAELGVNKSSLHQRLKKAGILTSGSRRQWTQDEEDVLRAEYAAHRDALKVEALAARLDRSIAAVCSRAYQLGLTGADVATARDRLVRVQSVNWHEDRSRILESLMTLGCLGDELVALRHDGEPTAKPRARHTRMGHTYMPADLSAHQSRLALRFAVLPIFRGNVGVGCVFYRSSMQRIDTDNLMKLVLDAGTEGGMWDDDSQVTASVARIEYDAEHPRTVIAMMPHVSSLPRGSEHWPRCAACGEQFNPSGRTRPVFCSKPCRERGRPVPVADEQMALAA